MRAAAVQIDLEVGNIDANLEIVDQVDLVIGGSGWWSIPPWPPRPHVRRLEATNARRAIGASATFATYVGVPIVHAAHSGQVDCPLPWTPVNYHGHFEGGASVSDADGNVLAMRTRADGPGLAIADVTPGPARTTRPLPNRFWLQRRGAVASLLWASPGTHGRRDSRRTGGQRPLARPEHEDATVA